MTPLHLYKPYICSTYDTPPPLQTLHLFNLWYPSTSTNPTSVHCLKLQAQPLPTYNLVGRGYKLISFREHFPFIHSSIHPFIHSQRQEMAAQLKQIKHNKPPTFGQRSLLLAYREAPIFLLSISGIPKIANIKNNKTYQNKMAHVNVKHGKKSKKD